MASKHCTLLVELAASPPAGPSRRRPVPGRRNGERGFGTPSVGRHAGRFRSRVWRVVPASENIAPRWRMVRAFPLTSQGGHHLIAPQGIATAPIVDAAIVHVSAATTSSPRKGSQRRDVRDQRPVLGGGHHLIAPQGIATVDVSMFGRHGDAAATTSSPRKGSQRRGVRDGHPGLDGGHHLIGPQGIATTWCARRRCAQAQARPPPHRPAWDRNSPPHTLARADRWADPGLGPVVTAWVGRLAFRRGSRSGAVGAGRRRRRPLPTAP